MKASERRPKVARLYLSGKTQPEIAEEFGVNQSTISRDLKAIQQTWREAAIRDFDEARGQELAKLDNLELTYWQAWERSLGDFKVETSKARLNRQSSGEGDPRQSTEKTVKTEERNGDPRYLQGVLSCIDRRVKLLGLDAPEHIRISWQDKLPPGYDPDDVQSQFVQLMQAAAQATQDVDDADTDDS